MMNAAAPMIGGMRIPPDDERASIAAATLGLNPPRFMRGMVKVPTVATLAIGEPEIMPMRLLPTTAVFAVPPRHRPAREKVESMKNWPPPVTLNTPPKMTKRTIREADTPIGIP